VERPYLLLRLRLRAYEHDNEKWSVPGRHGYRMVFATWEKVAHDSDALLRELAATLAA
jgi:hypothetical protein